MRDIRCVMLRAMLTRRSFVQRAAAAAVVFPLMKNDQSGARIGFSTLGCPKWVWKKVLDFAQQYRFDAVELRGLEGQMDLPARPEFSSAAGIKKAKQDVAAHGLVISCVSSSTELHHTDPAKNDQQLRDGRRFIDLASALGAPYVRVFGNKIVGSRDEAIDRIARRFRELADYAGPRGVTVIIESHGDFTDSATLKEILTRADSPHAALLWDAHHTFAAGKEQPEYTYAQLGKWIRHTHLKDSVPQ